jgi:pilus assembly protein FimV
VTQQSENQFDDLTVGIDADGSFSTESIDLFEFSGGEESPIARLKTIILSIDWEINDDILQQLDDELVDLGEIWADDKIKQVYIQGLSKIGKYIYKEKANAHPNSIKLLITFYHNLEKIVSSEDIMTEEEKKALLLGDVQKFDQLKSQIGETAATETPVVKAHSPATKSDTGDSGDERLSDLKALVLGLDWEITDQGLQKLQDEVKRLETVFREDKAKRILLQGIGAVSAYINKMRSQSNSKSFSLLHSFSDTLETITLTGVSAEQEKKLLLTEVGKFNAFKQEIAASPAKEDSDVKSKTVSAPAKVTEVVQETPKKGFEAILPADTSADEDQVSADVSERLESVFGAMDEPQSEDGPDKDVALEGVNIETEADDDSDEDALPYENGAVAPALADVDEESSFSVEKLAGDLAGQVEDEDDGPVASSDDSDTVVPGVDVESEADDESEEEALPFEDGEVAPALSGSFDDEPDGSVDDDVPSEDLDNRLDSFFDDEVESSLSQWGGAEEEQTELSSEDEGDLIAALSDEPEEGSDSAEDIFASDEDDGDLVAALSDESEEGSDSTEDIFASDEDDGDLVAALSDETVEDPDSAEDTASSEKVEELLVDSSIPDTNVDTEGSFEDDNEEVISPADEKIEENVEEQLSIFDDEVPSSESDMVAALSSEESDVDEFEEASSFDGTGGGIESIEDTDTEEQSVDDTEFDTLSETSEKEAVHEELTAADEPVDSVVHDEAEEEITFLEDETDELVDPDGLASEFTEQSAAADTEEIDELFDTEEIEFTIPGESSTPASITPVSHVTEIEEVVFEAVDDDIEVDMLPGEHFSDDEESSEQDGDDVDESSPTSPLGLEHYNILEAYVFSYREGRSNDALNTLLAEINRLRASASSDFTSKIYLQLLSSACQTSDNGFVVNGDEQLSCMEEIVSSLKLTLSDNVDFELGQEQLLRCTSQVLLLQQGAIKVADSTSSESSGDVETTAAIIRTADKDDQRVPAETATVSPEESLKSFVQDELADIRKIFLDEISSLRKEFKD